MISVVWKCSGYVLTAEQASGYLILQVVTVLHIEMHTHTLVAVSGDDRSLRLRGLSCSYISGGQEEDAEGVKKGDYRLVFFTPEMLLERRRWRNMLKGSHAT